MSESTALNSPRGARYPSKNKIRSTSTISKFVFRIQFVCSYCLQKVECLHHRIKQPLILLLSGNEPANQLKDPRENANRLGSRTKSSREIFNKCRVGNPPQFLAA